MNIAKRICRLAAVVGVLALAAGVTTSGNRVNQICVVAGDIDYCTPHDL